MSLILNLLLTSSLGIGMMSCTAIQLASQESQEKATTNTSLRSATENLQVLAREETEKETTTAPGSW